MTPKTIDTINAVAMRRSILPSEALDMIVQQWTDYNRNMETLLLLEEKRVQSHKARAEQETNKRYKAEVAAGVCGRELHLLRTELKKCLDKLNESGQITAAAALDVLGCINTDTISQCAIVASRN